MSMEVKINKNISEYTEKLFFGLSLRQFLCAAVAVAVAVFLYFLLRNELPKDVLSTVCALGAAPFAFAAFKKFHGLPLERFILVWLTSSMMPKQLTYQAENTLHQAIQRQRAKDAQERCITTAKAILPAPGRILRRKTGRTLGAVTSGDADSLAMRKDG